MHYNMTPILLAEFYKLYGIKESDSSMNLLYQYFYIKTGIIKNSKNVCKQDLMNFVFKELNVQVFLDTITYKGIDYNANDVARDFIDNLEFRATFEGELNIKEIQESVYLKGYKESKGSMKSRYYKTYIKYNRLMALNKHFKISPETKSIKGFKTDINYNPLQRTIEEQLRSVLDSDRAHNNTTQYISEADLEDFLSRDLNSIEEGLTFLKRQVIIEGGVIDILAKDKNGKLVIIELKVDNDKSLIWQSMHYPQEISKAYNVDRANIRMLAVAPSYKRSIFNTLNRMGNVEIYSYSIEVSFGSIQRLQVRKDN